MTETSNDAKKAVKTLAKYVEQNLTTFKDKSFFGKRDNKAVTFEVRSRMSSLPDDLSKVMIDFNQATDFFKSKIFDFPQILLEDGDENQVAGEKPGEVSVASGLDFDHKCPTMLMMLVDDSLGYAYEMGYLVQRNPIVDRLVIIGLTQPAVVAVARKFKIQVDIDLGNQILSLVNGGHQFLISDSVIGTRVGHKVPEESVKEKNPLLDGLER